MQERLQVELIDLMSPYFSDAEIHRVVDILGQREIDDAYVFYQVVQSQDQAAFEIAFRSGATLVDLTYKSGSLQVTTMAISAIAFAYFHDTESSTKADFAESLAGAVLTYTATTDVSRSALRAFSGAVQSLMARDGIDP